MLPTRFKSGCASPQSDQSLRSPHEETLHPLLSKILPVKIQIRFAQSDLNLRWVHISEGTFSSIAAHMNSAVARTLRLLYKRALFPLTGRIDFFKAANQLYNELSKTSLS